MASLEALPNEILWHIFSFLKPSVIIDVLPKVSRRFHDLVHDQSLWRRRVYSKWPTPYPVNPTDWIECCRQREEHWDVFSHWEDGGNRLVKIADAHAAAMDAIKFLQGGEFCVSGGRDYKLKIWKISPDGVSLESQFGDSHEAWVWCVEQLSDDKLVSGSFDKTVKIWDMREQKAIQTVPHPAPVLSIAQKDGLFACGTVGRKVHLTDLRCHEETSKCFDYHTNIVLSLAMDDKHIMSGSKDGTVAYFDLRAERVVKTIKLNGYPTAISHRNNQTWVGTSRGYIACISADSDNPELIVQRRISNKSIRSLSPSWGSVLATAGDDCLIVFEPTMQMKPIKRETVQGGITKATIHDKTICASGASGELLVWVPE